MRRVAVGFSVHTGWAAIVAVGGLAAAPVLLARRELEMIAGSDSEKPPFVYHAARGLAAARAGKLLDDAAEQSLVQAQAALDALAVELGGGRGGGLDGSVAGIVVCERAAPAEPPLAEILASHAAIHAAEGRFYRHAIRRACAARGIAVADIRARELAARGAEALDVMPAALAERLAAIGRVAGRPWAKDQKDAFVAAVVALAGR